MIWFYKMTTEKLFDKKRLTFCERNICWNPGITVSKTLRKYFVKLKLSTRNFAKYFAVHMLKVWVFWEGYKIWKKSSLYFWQEWRVLCAQQRTCQKIDEDFFLNVDKSYFTNFKIWNLANPMKKQNKKHQNARFIDKNWKN